MSGETPALVMELVEGPTLAERLESGALPLTDTLLLSHEIAEALEEAHEKGIVHRDLKPQNIKASLGGDDAHADHESARSRGRPEARSLLRVAAALSPRLRQT